MYGSLFSANSEAAFSIQSILISLGRISSFFYSPFLCMTTKLYILLSILPVGSIGLIIVEVYVAMTTGSRNEEEAELVSSSNQERDNRPDKR